MKNTTFKRNTLIGVMTVILSLVMVFTMAVNEGSHAASPTPGKVTLTKISSPAYNKVTVSWKKVSNATHYKVYYREAGTSKWIGLKTLSNKYSSYTHTSSSSKKIVVGQKYNYTVKAYNSKSKKYGKYNTKGLTVNTIPATVKLGKATLDSNKSQVTVTWNKAGGANKYVVYRKTSYLVDGWEFIDNWKKIATVSSSTLKYTDKNPVCGRLNIYTVKSYYSPTKTYGKYNSKGVYVSVPKSAKPTPKPEPDKKPEVDVQAYVQKVIELTNKERAAHGDKPLIWHPLLEKAAMTRAKELEISFSHIRPDGRHNQTALWDVGIGGIDGDNIARGYNTPESVVKGWMNSPGHRAAILSPEATHIGVGYYRDKMGYAYWVQEFATTPDTEYKTTFNAVGGTFPVAGNPDKYYVISHGEPRYFSEVPVPTKSGYKFGGWVSEYGEENLAYFGATETFHAKWI